MAENIFPIRKFRLPCSNLLLCKDKASHVRRSKHLYIRSSVTQGPKKEKKLQKPAVPFENVAIPNTFTINLISSASDRALQLNVALPNIPEPAQGYRALYLFDGNSYFGTTVEAVRANGNAPDVIVIGIGYPDSPDFIEASIKKHGPVPPGFGLSPFAMSIARERTFDLSLPMTAKEIAAMAMPGFQWRPGDLGGVDALLTTLEQDIKPRIAEIARINPSGTALFGHSLGGLAVLRALFKRPDLFQTFIAASPSIWLNGCAVLHDEASFANKIERFETTPRVLITMGAEESSPPKYPVPGFSTDDAADMIARANMVENARRLVSRLQALSGGPGFEVADYALFKNQGHGISVWPAIGRAVDFAFQQ